MTHIIGISGSLRKASYNTATLRAISNLLPNDVTFEILDISNLPFFNEELEDNLPNSVVTFKDKLVAADGVVIATPEYNYSIPGVLKNALDWASRREVLPLNAKPVALVSASLGKFGGVRAQRHIRDILLPLNAYPLNNPEVFISEASKKIDETGNVIDEQTIKFLNRLISNLLEKTNH